VATGGTGAAIRLHLDVADGQIPISAVLTGANVHDSQVVTSLYALMDSAYDAYEIHEHTRAMSQVPIIKPHNCGRSTKNVITGARQIRVRGAEKVATHLMFGVLALTVDQHLRLSG
jgi:hypothetical protein